MPDNEEIMVKVKNSISPNPTVTTESNLVDPILKGFFRLDEANISSQDRDRLNEINDFLGDLDGMERIKALKDIRYKLGTPGLGMSDLQSVHKYVRIKNSIKQKETELLSMEQ